MTTSTPAVFESLSQELSTSGLSAMLESLAGQMRESKQYYELFEVLKMQVRHELGLPLAFSDDDSLDEATRGKLDDGLFAACREVGMLLVKQGRVRDGWMYLRPVGDRKAAAEAIKQVEPTEENLEEIVEVLLHEALDVERGFALMLEHFGTCNSITTFESHIHQHARPDQQKAAALVVKHVWNELFEGLKNHIAQQEGAPATDTTISKLLIDRDWLFADGSYHIDTTHLAATVRAARLLDNPDDLKLAIELTEYGKNLSAQLQYKGDEPFADLYPSHRLYLKALLGEDVDEAVDYFKAKAVEISTDEWGSIGVETYIDLLARLERYDEAIDASIQLMPDNAMQRGIAPPLLELCQKAGDFSKALEYFKARGDLLSYGAALAYEAAGK